MSLTLILYAVMGAALGGEHYFDAMDSGELTQAEAILAAAFMGLLWFPLEFWGAAGRVWERYQ